MGAFGQQGHLRRPANRTRKITGGPHRRRRHLGHGLRIDAVQPGAKRQPQHQGPDNRQRYGPPQAGHQRHDLRREIKPQRDGDHPLAEVAQRRPTARWRTGHRGAGRRQQRPDHPGQGCAQVNTEAGGGQRQQQGPGNVERLDGHQQGKQGNERGQLDNQPLGFTMLLV